MCQRVPESHRAQLLTDFRENGWRPTEHHAASNRETGVAGNLDDTGALVAEHQRRLDPMVSTRQDRMIERRDAGAAVSRTIIPKALPILATAQPMLPRPRTPSVRPAMSSPTDCCHPPLRSDVFSAPDCGHCPE